MPISRNVERGTRSAIRRTAVSVLVVTVLAGFVIAGCATTPPAMSPAPAAAPAPPPADTHAPDATASEAPLDRSSEAPPPSDSTAVSEPGPRTAPKGVPVPVPVRTQAASAAPPRQDPSPAVAALLHDVRLKLAGDELNAASVVLERALRIQPYNAAVWLELARLRFAQQRFIEAESLARKAQQLAGRNRELAAQAEALAARSASAVVE